jgi:hypothetical protein
MVPQLRAVCCAVVLVVTQTVFAGGEFDLRSGRAGRSGTANETSADRDREALARSGDAVRNALDFKRSEHKKSAKSVRTRHQKVVPGPLMRTNDRMPYSVAQQRPDGQHSSLNALGYRFPLLMLVQAEHWIGLFRTAEPADFPEELARAQFSCRLAEKYFARAIERDEIVDDVILGTKINGTGHVSGNIRFALEPSPNEIRFNLIFTGVCRSRTQGLNDVVILQNTADTQFQARKQFVWGSQGLTALPATATAETHSTTRQINSTLPGLRGWIATGIAEQRVAESRAQADAISSQHSADRIRRGLDVHCERSLAWVRLVSNQVPASSVIRRGAWLELSSTSDALHLVLRRRGTAAPATRTANVALPPGCDMAMQIHRETLRSVIRDPLTLLVGAGILARIRAADRPAVSFTTVPTPTGFVASRPPATAGSSAPRAAWQLAASRDGQWLMAQHVLTPSNLATEARRSPLPIAVKPVVATSLEIVPAAGIR